MHKVDIINTSNSEIYAALQRLGFTTQVAIDIMYDKCIDILEELRVLDDKEGLFLCKVVRRPGGPTSTAGTTMSMQAEANLKFMVFYLKYLERTSRQADTSNITLANVRSLPQGSQTVGTGELGCGCANNQHEGLAQQSRAWLSI